MSMNRTQMLESEMYFKNWHMCWLESSFQLAWEQQSILWDLRTMSSSINLEWILMEEYIWSLLLLLPIGRLCSSNVCLLLSTDASSYRYHLMASEDLRAWLWVTIILGNRQWNYAFISQYSEQKHLSKATRPGGCKQLWSPGTRGAHSSWH